MRTINISIPKNMYEDAKKILSTKHYASISELMRDALRRLLYQSMTENGFTEEFEQHILHSSSEPMENDIVLEKDDQVKEYFIHLQKPSKAK